MPAVNYRSQVGWAWLGLCAAVALHVMDEALTGFLSVYNPTVEEIRRRIPWAPVNTFTFDVWLSGLILAVVLLAACSLFVFLGLRWTRAAGYVFAGLMLVNAVLHTAGTVRGRTFDSIEFPRPMPGFYSSPLLAGASLWLLSRLWLSRSSRGQAAH